MPSSHRGGRITAAVALAAAVITLTPGPVAAEEYGQGHDIGIGGLVGEPMAFSMKWLIGGGHGLQAVFGFDVWYRDGFLTAVDWVWHPLIIVSQSKFDLSFHIGAGMFLGVWYNRYWDYGCRYDPAARRYYDCHDSDAGFGGHFPVGLDFLFQDVPIELSLEFAPGVWFYPYIGFSAFGGAHVRYFF